MYIKKVIVDWDGVVSNYRSLRILFYDKDGKLFESGNIISNNDSYCETENFKVTHVGATTYLSTTQPIYAVLTTSYKDIGSTSSYCYFKSDPSTKGLFTIEFKTAQLISKIKVCTKIDSSSMPNATLRLIDINDQEESYIIDDTGNDVGTIHEYNLITYNTNKIGIAETTISTNIQKIEIVKGINVDYEMPNDTEIRMALSNDDRNTYKIFDGSNWIVINKNYIASSGMLPSFVNANLIFVFVSSIWYILTV